MGVKGFTTFMRDNSSLFLESFQLKNSYLVIDGNGISINLYNRYTKSNDCFGGDYDSFANVIRTFLQRLLECKITPIFVFDGGYETRKLNTIHIRMRNRIKSFDRMNSATEGKINAYPLFTKELFIDIAQELEIRCLRADFEGDSDTVCLARKLNCPILGEDSDYYFFNVPYIPFSYFEMRSNQYFNSQNKQIEHYVPCKIFYIENFLKYFGGMSMDNLVLLPVLLGNDYIGRNALSAFYEHIKLGKHENFGKHQTRIRKVIQWLRNETLQSALIKILQRFKSSKRRIMHLKFKQAMRGYLQKETVLINYLNMEIQNDDDLINEIDIDEAEVETDEDCVSGNDDDSEDTEEAKTLFPELKNDVESTFSNNINNFSTIFYDMYRQCLLPVMMMDLLYRNTYFFTSQIEDHKLVHSHSISLKIVQYIHQSIKEQPLKDTDKLKCVVRHGLSIKKEILSEEIENVPKFENIYKMSKKQKIECILQCLNIPSSLLDLVDCFPPTWQLFIIAIYFWKTNTTRKINSSHLYALIVCSIVLNFVDKKVGYCRNHKALEKIKNTKIEPKCDTSNTNSSIVSAFENINLNDSISCLKVIMNDFFMNTKMSYNSKFYDISIVDCFSEFQSVLYHVRFLNSFLGFPYKQTLISNFFNGTLLYNLTTNFSSRVNLNSYIEIFLSSCPSVLNSLGVVMTKLENNIGRFSDSQSRKRRRKHKKSKQAKVVENETVSMEASDDEDDYSDNRNKFSLLRNVQS